MGNDYLFISCRRRLLLKSFIEFLYTESSERAAAAAEDAFLLLQFDIFEVILISYAYVT